MLLLEYSQLIGGFLIGLLTWFAKEAYGWAKIRRLPNKHDEKVFQEYRHVFDDKFVNFLMQQDLSASFKADKLSDLYEFVYSRRGELPDYKFHDKRLERLRLKLWLLSKKFVNECMAGLHDEYGNGYLRVPRPSEWDEERYLRQQKVMKQLHDRADELLETFLKLHSAYNLKFDEKIPLRDTLAD